MKTQTDAKKIKPPAGRLTLVDLPALAAARAAVHDSLDAFTKAYLECALWSSEGCEEHGFSDIALDTNRQAIKDCAAFQTDNAELLKFAGDDIQNGHDFWLSRNGHGAGFFDRGYVDGVGKKLQEAARIYGTVELYVGDDGKIYS